MFSAAVLISCPVDVDAIFSDVQVILDVFGKIQVHTVDPDVISAFKNDIARQHELYKDMHRARLSAQFTLAPLSIPYPGSIDVRVNVDGHEIHAGGVWFVGNRLSLRSHPTLTPSPDGRSCSGIRLVLPRPSGHRLPSLTERQIVFLHHLSIHVPRAALCG